MSSERATANQRVLSVASVCSLQLDESLLEPPQVPGTPHIIIYHLLLTQKGIHPFLNAAASFSAVASHCFEFPSKAHLSKPKRLKAPPPVNKAVEAASVSPGFRPGWQDHRRDPPNSPARFHTAQRASQPDANARTKAKTQLELVRKSVGSSAPSWWEGNQPKVRS